MLLDRRHLQLKTVKIIQKRAFEDRNGPVAAVYIRHASKSAWWIAFGLQTFESLIRTRVRVAYDIPFDPRTIADGSDSGVSWLQKVQRRDRYTDKETRV